MALWPSSRDGIYPCLFLLNALLVNLSEQKLYGNFHKCSAWALFEKTSLPKKCLVLRCLPKTWAKKQTGQTFPIDSPFGRCQKTWPSQEKLVIYYPLDNWEWGKFERYYPNNVAFFSTSRCCKWERETEWNKNWRVTTCFLSLIRYVTFPTTKDSWRYCRPWLLQKSQDTNAIYAIHHEKQQTFQ